MRQLTKHMVEGDSANYQLAISVNDEPGAGGACHLYTVTGFDTTANPSDPFAKRYGQPAVHSTVLFQNGPIKDVGVNGVTNEALLAILIDRMESFQSGPYACESNGKALDYMLLALDFLKDRTRERIARGVEGTHSK